MVVATCKPKSLSITTTCTSENTGFDDNDLAINRELHGFAAVDSQASEASLEFTSKDFTQKYADRSEGELEDIFFTHEPFSQLAQFTSEAGDVAVRHQISFWGVVCSF